MTVERDLRLDLERREVAVGTPITVRVRDTQNRPIENAVVRSEHARNETDDEGSCELAFLAPGFGRIVASKSPSERETYRPTTELVRVVPEPLPASRLERIGSRSG